MIEYALLFAAGCYGVALLLDLWRIAERHGNWLPVLDAVYGSAAYLPMSDGAEYRIWLSQSGLVARPLNAEADGAVRTWR